MYIIDDEKLIIHDASFVKYECQVKKIPEDKKRKIHTLEQVKRMIDTNHRPQYNGCKFCLAEYHQFDMTSIFSR